MHPAYRPFGAYRLILAVLVLLSHSLGRFHAGTFLQKVGLGNVGVMSFFVLSGFIISEALSVFYRGRPEAFLINRANRLYPQFLVALLLTVGLYGLAGVGDFTPRNLLGNVLALIPLAQNNAMGTLPAFDFIPIVWAVRTEVWFYLIAALAVSLGWCGFRPLALALLAAQIVTYVWDAPYRLSFYGQFIGYFVLGVALHRKERLVVALALGVSLVHYWFYVSHGVATGSALTSLVLFVLSLAALTYLSGRSVDRVKLDRQLGDLSYPVYLVHSGAIVFVATLAEGVLALCAVVVLTFALSAVLITAVEAPMRAVRARVRGVTL